MRERERRGEREREREREEEISIDDNFLSFFFFLNGSELNFVFERRRLQTTGTLKVKK